MTWKSDIATWKRRGMPERCAPPTDEAGWERLLRLVPGYDPFLDAGDEYYFSADRAWRMIRWFHDRIKHVKGEWLGKPIWLEPWQQAWLANLMGWVREDGTRRYRRFFTMIARKNAKTTMSAGLGLYFLTMDGEPGAECYCGAGSRDQARTLHDAAKEMIRLDPVLRRTLLVRTNAIVYEDQAASFKVLSREGLTAHGLNPSFSVVDELHAQKDDALVDALETAVASRRQPVSGAITTRDFDRESVCNQTMNYAFRVRDGAAHDPEFLPAIWAADDEDDWTDPRVWRKANPNLGVSVSADYLAAECRRAQAEPSKENRFKRLHLNMRTQTEYVWLRLVDWDACPDPPPLEELRGEACWVAVDLSSNKDTTSVGWVFAPREDGSVPIFWQYFIPQDTAHERERSDKVPYTAWASQGLITLTPGAVVDQNYVERHVLDLHEMFSVEQVGVDPWNAPKLMSDLRDEGCEVVDFRQGFRTMSPAAKEMEKLVLQHKLAHGGNPVSRWQAGNAAVEEDAAGNIKPSKKKSAERIDGVVTAAMCVGMLVQAEGEAPKDYEGEGIEWI